MTKRTGIIGTTNSTVGQFPTWRDDELQAFERDFLMPGVIQGIGTNFAVTQRGAGANMSVDVAAGRALVNITNTNLTPSKTYNVYFDSDAVENVAITAADLSNPRIDIICLKVDVSQNPDSGSGNIATIIAVAGTPSGSPAVPATPANCLKLAHVAVAASAASIVNANVTDSRTYVTINPSTLQDIMRKAAALTAGQTDSPNWLGTVSGTDTITASATPAVASYVAGMRFTFIVAVTNTGPVTININGVGAIAIKRLDGVTALVAGDFIAGQIVMIQYDGTNFQMLTPSGTLPANIVTGTPLPWLTRVAPTGYLLANGSAVSRSTYAALFSAIAPSLGAFTVTIASPAVFTLNSHGLLQGDSIYFTTTGALPTGLSANTLYYVISAGLTTNTFRVSASAPTGVSDGSAVNTTGSQSGVHTVVSCPYGLGDGSTTFNLPDLRGRIPQGDDKMGTIAASRIVDTVPALGITGGQEKAPHTHALSQTGISAGGGGSVVQSNITGSTNINVMSPYINVFWIIKT